MKTDMEKTMSDQQEYYHGEVGHCTIWGEVVDHPEKVLVTDNKDYGDIRMVSRNDLHQVEDTYEYKRARERADEIRMITAKAQENLDKVAEAVVDKALKDLEMRMRLNMAFGAGGGLSVYGVMITDELKKLISESGKKLAEGKKKSDF